MLVDVYENNELVRQEEFPDDVVIKALDDVTDQQSKEANQEKNNE